MNDREKFVINERALCLYELTDIPLLECKKAAVMFSDDDDALAYLESHDWAMGKLITVKSSYRSDYPKEKIEEGNPYYCCAECGVSDPVINGEIKNHMAFCAWRLAQG